MKERNVGYDFLRIISIFLVVIIHSNVAYLANEQGTPGWYFVMLMTSVCLVAVPLFFMVSGALLLDTDKLIEIKDLFFKRILKQAIPFIAWSLIYVLARIVMKKIPFGVSAFTDLLHTPAYYQFWFMYSLLAIYLLLPVLQAVVIKLERRHLEYVLALWLIFSTVIPLAQRYIPGFAISNHVDLILCEGYVGYFLLGFYLKKYHGNFSKIKALALGISGLAVTGGLSIIEYVIADKNSGSYQAYFYQAYLTPFVVIAVTGWFLFFSNLAWTQNSAWRNLIKRGSVLSIGVFYVHMLVITAFEHFGLTGEANIAILAVKVILTYIISLVIACIISKIPHVKKLLMGL